MTFLIVFLPLTLAVYHLIPKQWKNLTLLVASLIFYAWGEPVYIILMLLSILYSFLAGKEIARRKLLGLPVRNYLIFSVGVHVALLAVFKYSGLFFSTVNSLLPTPVFFAEIGLPIGISFYTFQIISYLIDVSRGTAPAQKRFISYALYISMFPQLIAGPIVRYEDIESQLENRTVDPVLFGRGARMFIFGLAKKAILANGIGEIHKTVAGQVTAGEPTAVLTAWIGAAAFALQIYFDFSGYSDMAIGLGRMFGFELKKNFDHPFISTSVTEFWRRWHISLGTWFREYVYIPLGGNRRGRKRQILNLLIVWGLTGLWHGAAWNFLFWGLYFGLLLIGERFLWGKFLERLPLVVRHLYTLLVLQFSWPLFFSGGLGEALHYLAVMFGAGGAGLLAKQGFNLLVSHWLLWAAGILCSTRTVSSFLKTEGFAGPARSRILNIVCVFLFLLSVACLITGSFNPFLYFRF